MWDGLNTPPTTKYRTNKWKSQQYTLRWMNSTKRPAATSHANRIDRQLLGQSVNYSFVSRSVQFCRLSHATVRLQTATAPPAHISQLPLVFWVELVGFRAISSNFTTLWMHVLIYIYTCIYWRSNFNTRKLYRCLLGLPATKMWFCRTKCEMEQKKNQLHKSNHVNRLKLRIVRTPWKTADYVDAACMCFTGLNEHSL